MHKPSISLKIFIGLVSVLAICAAVNVYMPQGNSIPMQELPASKFIIAIVTGGIMLILYGGLGFLGYYLSRQIGYADIWSLEISASQRLFIPASIGAALGAVFIIGDIIFSPFNTIGRLPHPPFPTSIFASVTAGIGEEILFRLFFISFWVWLIAIKLLKRRYQNLIFWIVSLLSSLSFAIAHIPSFIFLYGWKSIHEIPMVFLIELVLLNGIVAIFAAYYFRKYGFLAAVGIHFWTDIIWHCVYGIL